MDENCLIPLAQKGDMQAFSQLMVQYQNRIYAVAMRFCKNSEDARDVSQEAVMKIYRALGRYHGKAAFSTWVYAITKNAALDFLRKRSKIAAIEAESEAMEYAAQLPAPGPEQTAEQRERLRALLDIIHALPVQQRAVVVLRDIDGYTYEEIARILAISEGTVKSRLSRGREAVRKAWMAQQRQDG